MTREGAELALPNATLERVYPIGAGGFAPALLNNARVLKRLLAGPKKSLWHFFFAPNARSSQMGRMAMRVRSQRAVHTVASAPKADAVIERVLFADISVVLSRHTEERILGAGYARDRIVRIAPAIAPLEVPNDNERRLLRERLSLPRTAPLVVYPGDLEFGGGAELMLLALAAMRDKEAVLVMACRAKTQAAAAAALRLQQRAKDLRLDKRVHWLGETREIHALLGAADVVALPSTDLYAKMDYPLVLLEAMSMARAVVVASDTPAAELAERGGAFAVNATPDALAAQLDALIAKSETRARLGDSARKQVLTRFSADRMATEYEALYDRLLA